MSRDETKEAELSASSPTDLRPTDLRPTDLSPVDLSPLDRPVLTEAALAGLPVPAWIEDEATGRVVAVNQLALHLYRLTRAEFLALGPVVSAEQLPSPAGIVLHRRRDGAPIPLRLRSCPVLHDGRPARSCVAEDAAAELAAQRQAAVFDARLGQLLDLSSQWCYELDTKLRFSYLSGNIEQIFGVAPERVFGTNLASLPNVQVDPESAVLAFGAMRARQPFRDLTFTCQTLAGRPIHITSRATPMYDENGKYCGYRGISTLLDEDADDQATARRRLQGILAMMPQPCVTWTREGRVLAFNGAFHRLHGELDRTPVLAETLSVRELAAWQDATGLYRDEAGAALSGDALLALYEATEKVTCRFGAKSWMVFSRVELPVDLYLGLWLDVTAIKQGEADKRELEAQLNHSQRLEALGTLAGGIAHEINNSLVPVIALTKRVRDKLPPDSRERRSLEMVFEGGRKSQELVRQVLAFSRNRRDTQRQELFDLAATVEDAMSMMRATLPATIKIEQQIDQVPPLLGDPDRLHQVLVNLVTNASLAIGSTMGTISVALGLAEGGDRVRLSVADTGCGMDEATLARIFEPFFTTRNVGQGTGLGLAMVDATIKNHDGRIEVSSVPGRGSRFDIVLPLAS
jgi:signal transduction histidine kinase